MNAKVFPIIAILVVLLSGGALVYSLDSKVKKDDSQILFASPAEVWTSAQGFISSLFKKEEPTLTTPSPTPKPKSVVSPTPAASPSGDAKPSPTPKATPKTSPAPSATPKATPAPNKTTTPATCRRFTITHLDGSQSNRCYTSADYAELSKLSGQLSSAQTFYQFHMDGVARYQKLYDESGSSLWIDARNSSQASADQEQSKIGPLQLQMYTIESRGTN